MNTNACFMVIVGIVLSGCASIPERVIDGDALSQLSVPNQFQVEQSESSQIVDGLIDVFDDKMLEVLIQRSLQKNLDIQLAAQQLKEAEFNVGASRGDILPKLTGGLQANRSKPAKGRPANTYVPSLDVSWELDLWGKLRDRKAALGFIELAQLENYRALQDSIAAQVIQSWFNVVTAEKRVISERFRLDNLNKIVENNRRNYLAGLASLEDLAAVERDIAQTQVSLNETINNRNIAKRSLRLLLGEYPGGKMVLEYELPSLIAPPQAGMPASLLTERPDLRAAWNEVIAADKLVKVAHKEMFPSLALTGSYGTQSTKFSDLLHGATIWSLASNLALPLFNAGQLQKLMHVEQSRAEQAWIRYLQTALRAFQEVEQALDQEALLAEREAYQQQALNRAEVTAGIFEKRYRNGLVSILEYLTAQNAVFDIKSQLLTIRNDRLNNRVTLALAVGKGV